MNKRILLGLLAFFLLVIMLGFRFCVVDPDSWLTTWGTYFFIVPVLFFFSAALLGEKLNNTHLNAYTAGVIIAVLLVRGSWADNFVLQRLIAIIVGATISFIIYTVWLKK